MSPPQECLDEAKAVKTKAIEGALFAVTGSNIVVTHVDPEFLTALETLFGSTKAS